MLFDSSRFCPKTGGPKGMIWIHFMAFPAVIFQADFARSCERWVRGHCGEPDEGAGEGVSGKRPSGLVGGSVRISRIIGVDCVAYACILYLLCMYTYTHTHTYIYIYRHMTTANTIYLKYNQMYIYTYSYYVLVWRDSCTWALIHIIMGWDREMSLERQVIRSCRRPMAMRLPGILWQVTGEWFRKALCQWPFQDPKLEVSTI